jgi:hypothetical protein
MVLLFTNGICEEEGWPKFSLAQIGVILKGQRLANTFIETLNKEKNV